MSQELNKKSYEVLLRQCNSITQGRKLHSILSKAGYLSRSDPFFANLVVNMYGRCDNISDARRVFDSISRRNVYSWAIMLAAYAQNGHVAEAREIFDAMPSSLKNVVSWNSMISAYSQAGDSIQALHILKLMDQEGIQPNEITLITILDGCSSAQALDHGALIHRNIGSTPILADVRVGTALVDMYGKCGQLAVAELVFAGMAATRNVVTWNAMMAAYAQNGHATSAVALFRLMAVEGVKPDETNLVSALDASADAGDLRFGRLIHGLAAQRGAESRLLVATALVNMYGRCGDLDRAREAFDRAGSRDLVLWTALLGALAHNGRGKDGFRLFQGLDLEGFRLDEPCFISAMDACAAASATIEARVLHSSLIAAFVSPSTKVRNASVHMYGRCGLLAEARVIFEAIERKDPVSWNGILTAYAQHGHIHETLGLFSRMTLEGVPANGISFTSVLAACSHAGKLLDALFYLASMERDYGVCVERDHYAVAVDLLGRLGELHDAESLTAVMASSSRIGWMAYLSACKAHGNVEAAARAADRVLELDPANSAPYVLFSSANLATRRSLEQ